MVVRWSTADNEGRKEAGALQALPLLSSVGVKT